MSKVLWMSRHSPHANQIAELRKMFGDDLVIDQESRPFDDARQIANRFRSGGYIDIVIVAPLSVISVLCREGIRPLWAESVEESRHGLIDFFWAAPARLSFCAVSPH